MDRYKRTQLLVKLSLFFLQMTATLARNTTGQVCVIAEGDDAKAARLAALQTAFGKERDHRLDLLFVIDRSKSIGQYEFDEMIRFMHQLITYLSEHSHIRIEKTRTRITVLSFGIHATPEFDGISDSGSAIDACVLRDRLDSLQLMNDNTLESDIPRALSRAREILARSRSDGANENVKQIVWIFFDGADGTPLSYDGRTSEDWAKQLRADGTTIFCVGAGAWLKVNIERENRVAELATSKDHYACLKTWAEIIQETPSSPANGSKSGPVYTTVAEVYKQNCGVCPRGQECACDVIAMNYTCVSEDYIMKNKDGTPSWIIPVSTGLGSFVFLILIVVCVVKKKRNTRDKKEETKSDGVGTQESGSTYVRSIVKSESKAIEEQVMEDYPDVSPYQNDLEEEMPGWSNYLFELKNENHLLHLGIRSTNQTQWANTPGFKFSQQDTNTIERVLDRTSSIKTEPKLKVAGKTYVVDVYQGEITDQHLHAFRHNRKQVKECAWIARVNGYIIVGVAEENEDKVCGDVVYKIYRRFDPLSQ